MSVHQECHIDSKFRLVKRAISTHKGHFRVHTTYRNRIMSLKVNATLIVIPVVKRATQQAKFNNQSIFKKVTNTQKDDQITAVRC